MPEFTECSYAHPLTPVRPPLAVSRQSGLAVPWVVSGSYSVEAVFGLLAAHQCFLVYAQVYVFTPAKLDGIRGCATRVYGP